jgi:Mg-chelatase subunit ChlD
MGEADTPSTRASFFGLQLPTDRVVFVVDRSGSMSAPFGASDRSRYQEAVAQVLGFLRVQGDTARFRVILFGSGFASSSSALQPANERNLAALERWLGSRTPGGGTELRPAIEEAIALTPSGRCDLALLEADSVVVLCDGETAEGPLWVQPLLERVNGEACLVFHAVQIGGAGDGTLEALAEQTGGQHLRIAE